MTDHNDAPTDQPEGMSKDGTFFWVNITDTDGQQFWTKDIQEAGKAFAHLAIFCRRANERWWRNPETGERIKERSIGELLMLVVSELAEGFEGHRKGRMDDHLTHRENLPVELIDASIRIFDTLGEIMNHGKGFDPGEIFVEKTIYNMTRRDHTLAARRAKGGKKF